MRSRPRHYARMLKAWALLLAVSLFASGCGVLKDLPTLSDEDLEQRITPQTSKLFDARGRLLTTFHGARNRTVVDIKKIPEHVQQAVIAIEDERFYDHQGIDPTGVVRAMVHNITSDEGIQGASTITQQFVKNRIIAPGEERAAKTIERKLNEAALARQLEQRLSKKEILERYLNTVYFGNGAYGIQAAAKTYFGKPAKKLSVKQGATLAAVIKAPESYDPYDRRKKAKARRNVVIRKMEELGYLPRRQADKAAERPLGLTRQPEERRYPAAYFVDYVKRLLVHHPRFSFLGKDPESRSDRLFTGGLRIHTTVRREVQRAAERSISEVLTKDRDPHASLVAMDPATGHVLAMIGGRDYFEEKKKYSKLNLAISGRPNMGRSAGGRRAPGTGRQAGSAFKTFALAKAIEAGIPVTRKLPGPACAEFPDPNKIKPWKVCNYSRTSFGKVSLADATKNSVNTAFAKLILHVGPRKATALARRMGVKSPLLPVPSAVLGTNTVNPLDMATGYATLANQGKKRRPVAITKITGPTGEVLYKDESSSNRVLHKGVAYLTTSLLENVVEEGTGVRAQIGRPAAGKTGTAQEYRDAWFAGFTPNLVAAVWVGYPAGSISMKTACPTESKDKCIPTRVQVTGGSWPADIWAKFMKRAVKKLNLPAVAFKKPLGALKRVEIDTRTGCLAHALTPDDARTKVTVAASSVPTRSAKRCKSQRTSDEERSEKSKNDSQKDKKKDKKNRDKDSENASSQDDPTGSDPNPSGDPLPSPVPEPEPEPEPSPEPSPSQEPSPKPSGEPEPSSEPSPEPSPSGESEPSPSQEPSP